MSKELKDMLDKLNANVEQMNRSAGVKTAANTPVAGSADPVAPVSDILELESKGLTQQKLDEQYIDPLRKNFERLAKSSPVNFSQLGATKVLDDPYSFLREKNLDGTHKIPTNQLDLMIRGLAAINNTRELANAAGAVDFHEWTAKSGNPNQTIEARMY